MPRLRPEVGGNSSGRIRNTSVGLVGGGRLGRSPKETRARQEERGVQPQGGRTQTKGTGPFAQEPSRRLSERTCPEGREGQLKDRHSFRTGSRAGATRPCEGQSGVGEDDQPPDEGVAADGRQAADPVRGGPLRRARGRFRANRPEPVQEEVTRGAEPLRPRPSRANASETTRGFRFRP